MGPARASHRSCFADMDIDNEADVQHHADADPMEGSLEFRFCAIRLA
jgi:hypothetical protein